MELGMLDSVKLRYTEQHAHLVNNGRNSLLKFIDSIEQFGRSNPEDREAVIQHIEARKKTDRFRAIYNRLIPPDNLAKLANIREYQRFRMQGDEALERLYTQLDDNEKKLLDDYMNLNLVSEELKNESEAIDRKLRAISRFPTTFDAATLGSMESAGADLGAQYNSLLDELEKTLQNQVAALERLQSLLIKSNKHSQVQLLLQYVESIESESEVLENLLHSAAQKADPRTPKIPSGPVGQKALSDYLEAKHEENIAMKRLMTVARAAREDIKQRAYERVLEGKELGPVPVDPVLQLEADRVAMNDTHSFVIRTLKALEPYIQEHKRKSEEREHQHSTAIREFHNSLEKTEDESSEDSFEGGIGRY
jgi:hypothetical protein